MSEKNKHPKNFQSLILNIILVAFIFLMTILTKGRLLSLNSLSAIAFQIPLLGLLSLAQMAPMLSGGIDLSIVSTANLSGIIMATIMTKTAFSGNVLIAIIVGLIISILVGILNGFLISVVSVPAIIATLGTMIFIRGISLSITKGYVIAGFPKEFQFIGNGNILGIPVPFIIFVASMFLMIFLLNKTKYGLKLYMLGSNPIATLFSAVNNRAVIFRTHLLSSFFAGVASVVMISRFNAAQADYGESYLLLTVLACILGGISPSGGFGKVSGLFISVIVLQIIATGFNLLGFSSYLASALWGGILIFVILANRLLLKNE
ncbi:MAG: simple sugar transport system permease protein [Pseudothermotoga sp.]|nr:simple sugar transport system permease protein [Pseudothermotoga sp.]